MYTASRCVRSRVRFCSEHARRRMEEVQRSEGRATLEDIMYASVLEKFLDLGVDMLGSMDLVQVEFLS